ncbi:hypothetical protein L484_013911 [Morus notabilis]|uniref:Uncharacterized protein n=1 Tax=Morus notabilis TaxID=981085 RepID=W9QIL9_9ROSA|nr:hypothetical protein L484_013911 [Morus notabilis]
MVSNCSDETEDNNSDEEIHAWLYDPKPTEAIWEPSSNCEMAFWRTYIVLPHFGMPMLPSTRWGDGLEEERTSIQTPSWRKPSWLP